MKKKITSLTDALQQKTVLASTRTFTGIKLPDKNIPDRFLLVESDQHVYSFRLVDIEDEEVGETGLTRVRIKVKSTGHIFRPFLVLDGPSLLPEEGLDNPPPEKKGGSYSRCATAKDVARIHALAPKARTLASVAANWQGSCQLGEKEGNNCAHYLSDAFIRAGFTELEKAGTATEITEWCDWNDIQKSNHARPIRAKDMWAWFKSMSTTTQTQKPSKKGFWAVFQWDASYSGGHVLLYDSDADVHYGTGAHWDWSSQYFYQW